MAGITIIHHQQKNETTESMNVVTQSELSRADGAPLLRTGGEQEEEFLMAQFASVELHMSPADESEQLPQNRAAGTLYVTTKYVPVASTLLCLAA